MAKIPVSVCIIAKNEAQHIGECLRHLRKYDLEIIVTDTGSTDGTKEIAEKYADKVVDFTWTDDFAAARNYCACAAKNNWILAIDCDEYVTSMDIGALRILTQKFPRHIGVLRLKNLVPYGEGQKGYVSDDVPRMYNKNYYHFEFPIHEQLRFIDSAKGEDALDAFLLPMEVVHHGYALTDEEMKRKQQRNLELLNKALERNPDNGYLYFQIGQSNFVLGNMDAAIEAYETGMQLIDNPDKLYVAEMIMSLAKAYCRKGRFSDALVFLEQYSGIYNTAKFNFEYANILMENNQIIKALMIYIKVTTMKDSDTLGEHLMTCYGRIMDIYKGMGNHEMAEVFRGKYLKCAAERERVLNS
ncbi:MAG: glycosyltransferase [Lachnospiraceae bacterium]|nr:glycosyltransferase [Lachnospiraceae bacterium]